MAKGFVDARMGTHEYSNAIEVERKMDAAIERSREQTASIRVGQYELSSAGLAWLNAKYVSVGVRIEFGKAVDTAGDELIFELKAVRIVK